MEKVLPTADNTLFGHTSEETALVVDDYPYGYTLRTQIRYWIETTKRGDRFVSQTLNPKTNQWNKPKKSTYSDLMIMQRKPENGHISYFNLDSWCADDDAYLTAFIAVVDGKLSDMQKRQLALVLGAKKVMKNVTFEIVPASDTAEERAAHEAEQAEIRSQIGRAIVGEAHRARKTL